jgi:hypothetical protein
MTVAMSTNWIRTARPALVIKSDFRYSHSSQLTHAKRIKAGLVLRHKVRDAANKKNEIKCYIVQYLCKNDGSFHFHVIDKKNTVFNEMRISSQKPLYCS